MSGEELKHYNIQYWYTKGRGIAFSWSLVRCPCD